MSSHCSLHRSSGCGGSCIAVDPLVVRYRHQQVLNLTIPQAYAYLRDRIGTLVSEYQIDYLKWDHNRPLIESGTRLLQPPTLHPERPALLHLQRV